MAIHQQARFAEGQRVEVTPLSPRGAVLWGEASSFTGATMELLVDSRLEPGAAVKMEWDDTLVLGEVFSCQPQGGRWAAGVHLEHSVLHTADLARLARALSGPVYAPPPPEACADCAHCLHGPLGGA